MSSGRAEHPPNPLYGMRAVPDSASTATASATAPVSAVDVPVHYAPAPDAATRNPESVDETTYPGVTTSLEGEGTGNAGSSFEFAFPEILGDYDDEWEVESQDD
ncbi:hypothetical protein MKX08_005749 [Trichoderma sp. CBMAI-0020]|nr:hypothetical protein MKX08_005749 [Trichoderma sp. CBMAI-0020]